MLENLIMVRRAPIFTGILLPPSNFVFSSMLYFNVYLFTFLNVWNNLEMMMMYMVYKENTYGNF